MQQKILWAEVQKGTGRWMSRWTVRGLLADGRCGQAVLDFLSFMDVGRLAPPLEEGDARSEVSERELWEREGEQKAEVEELGAAGELGAGEELPLFLLFHGISRRGVGDGPRFFCYFLCDFLSAHLSSRDRPGRRAKGSLQRAATARTVDGKNG